MSRQTNEERLSVIETKLDNIMLTLERLEQRTKDNDDKYIQKTQYEELKKSYESLRNVVYTTIGTFFVLLLSSVLTLIL